MEFLLDVYKITNKIRFTQNLPINNNLLLIMIRIGIKYLYSVYTYLTNRRQSHIGKFELPVRQAHVHQRFSEIIAKVGS